MNPKLKTTLSLALCVTGAAHVACAGADADIEPLRVESRQAEAPDPDYAALISDIQVSYHELANADYRAKMRVALRQLGKDGPAADYQRLLTLLDEAAESGADGLEGLILSHADALARAEDPAWADASMTLLQQYGAPWYARDNAPLNLTIPIARADSRAVLSVRGDASRAMLEGLMAHPDKGDLGQLLGDELVQQDICGLTPAQDITAIAEDIAEADARRQQACEEIATGGGGAGPSIAGTMLAGATVDACMEMAVDAIFAGGDDYSDTDRLSDMEDCIGDIAGVDNTLAGQLSSQYDVHFQPTDESTPGTYVTKVGDTWDVTTVGDEGGLYGAVSKNLNWAVQRALSQVPNSGVPDPGPDPDAPDPEPENNSSSSTTGGESSSSSTTGESSSSSSSTTGESESESAGNSGGTSTGGSTSTGGDAGMPGAGGSSSEACERLMLDGMTATEARLGEDWSDFSKRLDPYINPGPEPSGEDGPADGFGLARCGQDRSSRRNACSQLAMCMEGEPCGCPGEPGFDDSEISALMAVLSQNACLTARCGDQAASTGVGAGMTCTCGGEQGDPELDPWNGPGPGPGPDPMTVNATLVDHVFLGAAFTGDPSEQPLDAMAMEVFRR